jgi:hypothetical protein
LTLNEATSINDSGEISGFGTLSDGSQHAFLLIPCDARGETKGCTDNVGSTNAASPGKQVSENRSVSPVTRRSAGPRGLASRALRHFGRGVPPK